MKRSLALLLALSLLALPSAALAQSAGDEQYADPFGEVEDPNGSQEDPAPAPEPAPEPSEPAVAGEETVASQQADAPTLPATGAPAHLLAGGGMLLLAAGASLRRRTL
jgi:LPXTG-motif cell wall-anchored protein